MLRGILQAAIANWAECGANQGRVGLAAGDPDAAVDRRFDRDAANAHQRGGLPAAGRGADAGASGLGGLGGDLPGSVAPSAEPCRPRAAPTKVIPSAEVRVNFHQQYMYIRR